MHRRPLHFAVGIALDADEVIARFRIVLLAHGVQREIVDAVVVALVPGVDMAAEGAGDVPFLELVQQEEGFLPGEGGGKLEELRAEDVGVREHEGIAVLGGTVVILAVQDPLVDQVDLPLSEGSAGGVQEDQVVKSDLPVLQEHDHVDLV